MQKKQKESETKKGITLFQENILKSSKEVNKRKNMVEKKTGKEKKSFMIKLVLIGDGAVGKTSIRRKYLGEGFVKEHLATLGADFAVKETTIDGDSIKFQIWDIAGQEFFKRVRSRFYRGCFGALAIFDLTRRETFTNLSTWLEELYQNNGRGVIPVIILGNKSDLPNQEISEEEIAKFVDDLNKKTKEKGVENFFLKTSAKTGVNIDKAFAIIGNYIVKKFEDE